MARCLSANLCQLHEDSPPWATTEHHRCPRGRSTAAASSSASNVINGMADGPLIVTATPCLAACLLSPSVSWRPIACICPIAALSSDPRRVCLNWLTRGTAAVLAACTSRPYRWQKFAQKTCPHQPQAASASPAQQPSALQRASTCRLR
jgi:hypothetical protein